MNLMMKLHFLLRFLKNNSLILDDSKLSMFRTARLELQPHCQVPIFRKEAKVFLGSVVASTLKRITETQTGTTVPQHLLRLNRTFSRKNKPCLCQSKPGQLAGSEIK